MSSGACGRALKLEEGKWSQAVDAGQTHSAVVEEDFSLFSRATFTRRPSPCFNPSHYSSRPRLAHSD